MSSDSVGLSIAEMSLWAMARSRHSSTVEGEQLFDFRECRKGPVRGDVGAAIGKIKRSWESSMQS
jgi:hypothetical protein